MNGISVSIKMAVLFALTLGMAGRARADGSNPYHLEASVVSPFSVTGYITSPAPGHHVVYGGDTSFDVVTGWPTAGKDVWFDVRPYYLATAIRGVVLSGGNNAPILACASGLFSDGGYVVQVEVQAYYNGTWTAIGWVKYAHLDNIVVRNGDVISNVSKIASVTASYGGTCSTGPHVHMEPYNYRHYACYTNLSPFSPTSTLARVGGGYLSLQQCP